MNNITDRLTSLQLEKTFLGGLFRNQDALFEVDNFLRESDFSNRLHETLYSILRQSIIAGEQIDKVLWAQRYKNLNISTKDEISNIFEYVDAISFTNLNKNGCINTAKEICKLRIRRQIFEDANEVQNFISGPKCENKTVAEIVSEVDSIYNKRINTIHSETEPQDLFCDIEELINKPALDPKSEIGIKIPFKIFGQMFGHLRPGIVAVCGRAKNNKSTFLSNVAWGAVLANSDLRIFYADTELRRETMAYRSFGALSQVNPSLLEKGLWIRNIEMAEKVKNTWQTINKIKGKITHEYVGNKSIEQIGAIIRKWYLGKVGRGNPAIIIYDYIKIGDEKLSNFNGEHQELGKKINYLNNLSQDFNVPVISSMQLNRSAITDKREDESAISMTDRLSWYANTVCILRKKRPEEIAEEGVQFGTHKLIPVVTRYQGDSDSLFDLVKVSEENGRPKYKQNFINYHFSSFLFTEKGTLRDIINHQNLTTPLSNSNNNQENTNVDI